MHGVLKVKTTAEQEAERRKEREEKAKKFKALTKQIFDKRKNEELDDELLDLTEKLLSANPDFYTMWNIRKEIFLKIKDERSEEELNKLYAHELQFLQGCLHVNPKSYGVWEHRRFALKNMPTPDWMKDLNLCNKFLSLDSRNFHCWDYRRFVVKNANVPIQEEFDFTTKKISENFSNYSAWHNRSKLLPLLHPDPKCAGKVQEAALLKEFELVQNAFFTDPNDQSAWFYQRWLLGREEKKLEILYCGVRKTDEGFRLVISLSKQINLTSEPLLSVTIDDKQLQGLVWKSTYQRNCPANIWITNIRFNSNVAEPRIVVRLDNGITKECKLLNGDDEASWNWHEDETSVLFRDDHTEAKVDVLNNELESCKMLLEEEAENKWVMLTVIFLMRALDPDKHSAETFALLDRLTKCDDMRKEYYRDLRSKYVMEDELRRMRREKENFETLDLRNKELTSIYHWEYLTNIKTIKLSSNKLNSLRHIHMLQNVVEIDLDANQLDSLDGFGLLPYINMLSLRHNNIEAVEELKKLRTARTMQNLYLTGNQVCSLITNESNKVNELLPDLEKLDLGSV